MNPTETAGADTTVIDQSSEPPARGLSLAQAVGLLVVFLTVFAVVTVPLEVLQGNGAISISAYRALQPLGQLVGWSVTIYLAWHLSGRDARKIRLRGPVPHSIIAPLLIASVAIGIVIVQATQWIPAPDLASADERVSSIEIGGHLILRLIIAPFAEEVFFRGLLLGGLVRRYGETRAMWASTVLFAIGHINPWLVLMTFPSGLGFAWLTLRTRTLVPSIMSHCVINLIPVVFSGYISYSAIEESEIYSPLLLALGIAGTVIGSAILWRRVEAVHGKQGVTPAYR